jgi:hypothetical protein
MLKKLEVDAIRADIGAVERLLEGRTVESDPLGFMQLSKRREALQARLNEAEGAPQHKAAIALFFAGGPVVGSRGIEATFASKAVSIFQDLVSKQFAMEEIGELGRRGPVSMQPNSDLIVTNVVRGSVGLLLEESDRSDAFADTQLKVVVDHVVDSIEAAAAPAADAFEEALERMAPRFLTALGEFFEVMDEQRALLRLVESEREVEFNSDAIHRGRERSRAAHIEERDHDEYVGKVFILPDSRRFDLRIVDGEPGITGTVSREFARKDLEGLLAEGNAVGERWRVRIRTRTLTRPARPPKVSYTLLGLIQRVD